MRKVIAFALLGVLAAGCHPKAKPAPASDASAAPAASAAMPASSAAPASSAVPMDLGPPVSGGNGPKGPPTQSQGGSPVR